MTEKSIIWATSQHWRSDNHVSSHHYARLLAEQGWRVLYLAHPVSPLHLLQSRSRRGMKLRWQEWRTGGGIAVDGRLRHYTPMTLLPPHASPLLSSRAVLDRWQNCTLPNLTGYLRHHGFDHPAMVVVDSERYGFLFDALPHARHVMRVVDCLEGFKTTARSWVEHERELIRRADVTVVTSRLLHDEAMANGAKKAVFIPNGVEFTRFAEATHAIPDEYAGIPRPRAVYVGAVEHWFDDGLLAKIASQMPEVSFVIVGAGENPLTESAQMRNVYTLGPKPYETVPGYMRHADVGIIPFHTDALTRTVNPIKLYEYAASGLPVVSTSWEELRLLNSPALLCRSTEEFCNALKTTINQDYNREQLRTFARNADWGSRLCVMMNALEMPLSPG